jgi:hypothetical protein
VLACFAAVVAFCRCLSLLVVVVAFEDLLRLGIISFWVFMLCGLCLRVQLHSQGVLPDGISLWWQQLRL